MNIFIPFIKQIREIDYISLLGDSRIRLGLKILRWTEQEKSTYPSLGSVKFIHLSVCAKLITSFENSNKSKMCNANSWLIPDEKKTQAHPYGLSVFRVDPEEEAEIDFRSTLRSVRRFLEQKECRNRNIREANFSDLWHEIKDHFDFYLGALIAAILIFALLIMTVDRLGEWRRCRNKRRGYETMQLAINPSVYKV